MAVIKLLSEPRTQINQYYEFDPEIKSNILGSGGMGIVFKGKFINNETGKFEYVAIKVLFKDLSEESIMRARREASIQVIHENIVRMYDFVETTDSDGKPKYHVISEYLEGETLDKLIKKSGIISQAEALKIVKNVLSALYMLHSRGYIHRDIDPSNIMICRDGKIKIIDFGIAKQILEYHDDFKQGTLEGKFIGKVNYASPEQAEGKHWITNATSDIYSTGVLLFELLTGRLPFTGTAYEVIKGHREQPIPISEILSPDLQYVINKATAKEQADRYQSAAEFIVDIEKIEKGIPVIPEPGKRWITIVSVACAIILILAAVSAYIINDRDKVIEEANLKLSIGLYSESLGLFKNANKLITSSDVNDNIAMLEVLVPAVAEYNKSNYIKADSLFKVAINLNSSDAYYYLGEMSYEGIGTPKNFKQGFEYTSKAAEMGNKLAEYRLGLIYNDGIGVKVDKARASKYFESAGKIIDKGVDNKTAELLFIKGNMYMNGRGVQKSEERGEEYYREAAESGYPQAQYELSVILEKSGSPEAIGWLKKSAEQDYPKAQYKLGRIAEKNEEHKEAIKWMLKSAEKNYSPAYQRLGLYYNQEYSYLLGIASNNSISHEYILKALQFDFENFLAMYDLWIVFSNGNGVEKDTQKALEYFKMAENKLNELPYKTINGHRQYEDSLAQNVWKKIQRNK